MLCVNPGINHQSYCPEKLVTKASQVSKRIVVVPSRLFRQPFAVQGSAFYVGSERNDLSKLRKVFEFFHC